MRSSSLKSLASALLVLGLSVSAFAEQKTVTYNVAGMS